MSMPAKSDEDLILEAAAMYEPDSENDESDDSNQSHCTLPSKKESIGGRCKRIT